MSERPRRLLVVCPNWLGDVVMATPALRAIRGALPGAFIGGLVRPGMDELLAGTDFFDELHVERAAGVMGPKLAASKVRPRRYDAAVLFTNSFSTALITRLAFIPRRIGYDRDGRGLLLTDRLKAERREPPNRGWKCVPAVEYYLKIAEAVVGRAAMGVPRLELTTTAAQEGEGERILRAAGVVEGASFAVVNPGANDVAKRWPAERFGEVSAWIARERDMRVLVNGSPSEREVVDAVVGAAGDERVVGMTGLGVTIGSLKAVVRRAGLMLTNDTGPRHIAAAFGVPTVTLYGPTDPRWTSLPDDPNAGARVDLVAEPNLPEGDVADDHPERCRIDRIAVQEVHRAVGRVLQGAVDRVLGG